MQHLHAHVGHWKVTKLSTTSAHGIWHKIYTHTHNTGTVSQASRSSLADVYMHSSNTRCTPQYMCRWHERIEALSLSFLTYASPHYCSCWSGLSTWLTQNPGLVSVLVVTIEEIDHWWFVSLTCWAVCVPTPVYLTLSCAVRKHLAALILRVFA